MLGMLILASSAGWNRHEDDCGVQKRKKGQEQKTEKEDNGKRSRSQYLQ